MIGGENDGEPSGANHTKGHKMAMVSFSVEFP